MKKVIAKARRSPNLIESVIPIVLLIVILSLVIKVFHQDALGGAAQIAMLFGTAIAVFIAMVCCRIPWDNLENKIKDNLKSLGTALIMLLLIGSIGSTWMLSGVVPTMIVYGMDLLSPKIFLFASVLICSIISVSTGSSWTTVATFGVALVGIGEIFGIPKPIVAGAIISGAYFGDKISPLSDTTIIASQTVGTPLFVHIKYMLKTTIPTISITLAIFLVIGLTIDINPSEQTFGITEQIRNTFNISPLYLIVPVLTGVLIALKLPTLITLFLAAMMAIPFMIIGQPQIVDMMVCNESKGIQAFMAAIEAMYKGFEFQTGQEVVDSLATTTGMSGMMGTIWLILCAACFGGVMLGSGMIESITKAIVRYLKSTFTIISATSATGIICNICVGDQYLAIILNSSLYKNFYKKKGYEPRLLSRTVEDSTTVTSVLIPWNTCGMTQATVLGVPTLTYIPYCFFNYISPIMTILITTLADKMHKIKRLNKEQTPNAE